MVGNKAVCYNPDLQYSVIRWRDSDYILGQDLLQSPGVQQCFPGGYHLLTTVPGSSLAGVMYQRPLYTGDQCPMIPGGHVTSTAGTGLVHTAPAHGQDDFKVGLQHGLEGECLVGEDGRYLPDTGLGLAGLDIFSDGGDRVLELLSDDVMYSEVITHSYPYDWRTKKPVFLRASKQWFINTDKLKHQAMSVLESVEIQPDTAGNGFRGVVDRRPYWCISRQRVWGTFIPVIYQAESGDVVISEELIRRYQQLVESEGPGFWWSMTLEQILATTSYNARDHTRQ